MEKKINMQEALFWLPLAGVLLIFLGLASGCLSSTFTGEAGFIAGVYEGTGRGYRGPVQVRIQVSPAGIEDIVISSHQESMYPGAAAMEELLDMVLETGSTDLDAVSGATYSSRGFLEAVEDALAKAASTTQ